MLSDLQPQVNTVDVGTGTYLNTNQDDESSTTVDTLQETTSSSDPPNDSWRAEYEAQVEIWRTQSSEAREKAEKVRKRWEETRALEQEEAARLREESRPTAAVKEEHEAGWETLSNVKKTRSAVVSELHSPSPADTGDLLTCEPERQVRQPASMHCVCVCDSSTSIPVYYAEHEPQPPNNSPPNAFTPGRGIPEMGGHPFFCYIFSPIHDIPRTNRNSFTFSNPTLLFSTRSTAYSDTRNIRPDAVHPYARQSPFLGDGNQYAAAIR